MFSYFPDMGFLDATDLLLQTEKAIYNEKYKCLLQKHLRERGLISPEVSLECYDPSISFEANFTSKAVCKSDKTRIGIKPESLINKENTYFWTPSNYLQEYNTSNPIFESTNSFTYQVTVCDKLGKCNSKNINITINNCHLEIEFYNSMAFSNGSVSLTIRLPDTDTLLLGYSLQIFNDQGRLVGNKTLDNKYFNYFHTNELPDVKGIYILKIVKIEQQKSTITKTYKVAKI